MMDVEHITSEDTHALRLLVLRPGGSARDVSWPHDTDESAFHLGVRNGAGLIGIGSFHPERQKGIKGPRQFRIRGMATHPDHRSRGAGSLIVQRGMEELRGRNVEIIWCNARIKAVPFYEREGFEPHGEPFELPGIGMHQVMWRKL